KMAGAVRHVSRRYTNRENGKTVDVWLIVGHSRDICRHTPNICYPSHGYSQKGAVVKQQIVPPATPDEPATFFTAKFADDGPAGRRTTRVFWAWNGNEEGKFKWEAPEPKSFWGFLPIKSAGPKAYYGNNTSLYKLYFTAELGEAEEPVGSNIAVEFAKLMLPEINRSLFPERYPSVERSTEPEAAADFGDEALEADEFPAAEESEDADAEAALESILD
ncbi:MAG TPA: hypothetical protein PJ982_07570, partial [Lacipirellulaceae bacterium]|nr:hypothetical protein [Lacipirellulaceae bacterium]